MPTDLPRWPIVFFGLAFPLLWVVGLGFVFLPLSGLLAAGVMIKRRRAVLPPGWYLWFAYLVIVIASVVQIDSTGRLIGFVLRLGMVLGATAVALYVYTATPRSVGLDVVYRSVMWLWIFVIVGGWLGILFPDVVLQTPFSRVVPGSLMSNELVNALVRPAFAQIEYPYGQEPIVRPAAPFQAANGWGCNIALMAPMIFRYIGMLRGWRRFGLILISLAGVVPAVATLNRGLFIGLGVALVYVAARALMAGRIKVAAAVVSAMAAIVLLASVTGVVGSVMTRLENSGTNDTRSSLYDEAIARTIDSPLLGYGAPRPSFRQEISVGTQGHVWNIMVSHGFFALAFYILYFVVTAWFGRNARRPADGGNITTVVGCVLIWFYGLDGPQVAILLLGGMIAIRDVRTAPWPTLTRFTETSDVPSVGQLPVNRADGQYTGSRS
jgi:hypothetical protein